MQKIHQVDTSKWMYKFRYLTGCIIQGFCMISYTWQIGLLHLIVFHFGLTHSQTSTKTGDYTIYLVPSGYLFRGLTSLFQKKTVELIGLKNSLLLVLVV